MMHDKGRELAGHLLKQFKAFTIHCAPSTKLKPLL